MCAWSCYHTHEFYEIIFTILNSFLLNKMFVKFMKFKQKFEKCTKIEFNWYSNIESVWNEWTFKHSISWQLTTWGRYALRVWKLRVAIITQRNAKQSADMHLSLIWANTIHSQLNVVIVGHLWNTSWKFSHSILSLQLCSVFGCVESVSYSKSKLKNFIASTKLPTKKLFSNKLIL